MSDEFKEARAKGELDSSLFYGNGYSDLCEIMDNPELFNFRHSGTVTSANTPETRILQLENTVKIMETELERIKSSSSYKIGQIVTFIPRRAHDCYRSAKEYGFLHMVHRVLETLGVKKEK